MHTDQGGLRGEEQRFGVTEARVDMESEITRLGRWFSKTGAKGTKERQRNGPCDNHSVQNHCSDNSPNLKRNLLTSMELPLAASPPKLLTLSRFTLSPFTLSPFTQVESLTATELRILEANRGIPSGNHLREEQPQNNHEELNSVHDFQPEVEGSLPFTPPLFRIEWYPQLEY